MIRCLWSLLFETRLDWMTQKQIEEAGERGELTFSEMKRIAKLERYARGLNR